MSNILDFLVDILYTKFEVIEMLDEKIKIRISGFLRETLELDAQAFNFVKNNNEANLNSFLNKLIPNLLILKKERREKIFEYAKDTLNIPETDLYKAEELINNLNAIFDEIYFSDVELNELTETIWIRPVKENISVFDEIIDSETEITGMDKSSYIRTLLNEFSRFPRYKKQQIVFAEECNISLEARDSHRLLKFRFDGDIHKVFVFSCVYNYLQEQGNYILCYDIGRNIICRYEISEVSALHLLREKFEPNEKIETAIEKYCSEDLWLNDIVIELGEEDNV